MAACLGLTAAMLPMPVAAGEALTNADMVALTEAGLGPRVIVAKIEKCVTAFDTSADALVALACEGVADEVLDAMVAAQGRGRVPPVGEANAAERSRVLVGPGSLFRDRLSGGGEGPVMVVIPAGRFRMGCLSDDDDCIDNQKPAREVTVSAQFALSVHKVTFADYDRFTYPYRVDDRGCGRSRRPAVMVSWNEAQDYVEWLSAQTGERYRLPSEAEWEYAARAGTTTQFHPRYHSADEVRANQASCDARGCHWDDRRKAPVGFAPNAFGLYGVRGIPWEWVEDCWNSHYAGAPVDGSAWISGDCLHRVKRGGTWVDYPGDVPAATRLGGATDHGSIVVGFRVARMLTP